MERKLTRLGLALVILLASSANADVEQRYDPKRLDLPPGTESQRLWIHNVKGGAILGSKDSGQTWTQLGRVTKPIQGGIWSPTVQGGVLAFNFLRGTSNVFGTAINAVHLRFSDPPGYSLPQDMSAALVEPHAVSLMPTDSTTSSGSTEVSNRVALTDMRPGTGMFGPEWSPKVGSRALMGDGVNFKPIPYDIAPSDTQATRDHILIITERASQELEYFEFENKAGGKIWMKREGEEAFPVAKVYQAVQGIGRFEGSEFAVQPGNVRANHAGVLCIATTDLNQDPSVPKPVPAEQVINYRGGFQVVALHHYHDRSMSSGGDHAQVYLVAGPLQDPPHLKRYDIALDGSYPLFYQGLRAGQGKTFFQFDGASEWIELSQAVALGKFRRADGTVMQHLRGYVKDALVRVTAIRIYP